MWLIETKILGGNWKKHSTKGSLDEALEAMIDPCYYDHRVRRITDVQEKKDSQSGEDAFRERENPK